jgi:WD40 repeat protein
MHNDQYLTLWNAGSGEAVAILGPGGGCLSTCAFSATGRYIAAGADGAPARVWYWKPKDLLEEACSRLSRNLTREEWKTYLPGERYRKTCPEHG